MKRLGIAALVLLLAAPVFAQTAQKKATFTIVTEQPREQFEVGAFLLNTGSAQVRVAYLPRLAPLPGTFPTRTWGQIPNAFELTGMQIPEPPRTMPAYISTR